jgi:fatty acid desaturase
MPPHVQNSNENLKTTTPGENIVRKELLYEGYYYDVTEWVKKHPGGRIIEFYTQSGEDATITIQQFHQRSTKKVMGIMNSLKKRPALETEREIDQTTSERHKALSQDFLKLYQDLLKEGMFKPSIGHVTYRILELVLFAIFGMYFISSENTALRVLALISFAFFQGRSGWLMHEGGHHSLTGNSKVDRFLQAIIYGLGDGMASTWWSSQHNRHHAMPQRLKRDVDLETLPLLAFNAKVVKNPKHGKSFFVQNQANLFLAIDTLLVALMWKIYLHPRYVLQRGQYYQFLFMAGHYILAYQMGFFNYIFTVWLASVYIFGNFSLSHTHLPVTQGPLHWVEYALMHTMDIEPSWWCDWWMAHLNYQIEHHLFPTMPQFRHRQIVPRVKALAEKHGIPYHCASYTDAVALTYSNLQEVAKDLRH